MDDLFGQIECTSKSDSIVMRILRSAMDKAHEKVQSKDGPIEFLHARSTFYELAAILVEGGLYIVQEEMEFLEGSQDKVLADLLEIKDWLHGRIKDMKHLIVEKDKELTERLDNESKLRQALKMREKEIADLDLELGKVKNDGVLDFSFSNQVIQDGSTDGDISKLKNSLDQQVWNIKQKLEDDEKIFFSDTKKITSHVSSPNLSFEFLNKERNECSESDKVSKMIHPETESSRQDQNVLIRRMSSDIDILKETLDLAFGTLQSAEVLPLEKQWRCTVEKDVEYSLVKGFISDVQHCFDLELRVRVGLAKDNWFEFMNEMKTLCYDLKAVCSINNEQEEQSSSQVVSAPSSLWRTGSEPLPDISCIETFSDENNEVSGSHFVAKMIKNHESIIQNQSKDWNWLAREGSSSLAKINKDRYGLERRMEDAIIRLENLIKRNHNFEDKTGVSKRYKIQETNKIPKSDANTNTRSASVEISDDEVGKLKEERDVLRLQISLTEEIYQLLFRGIVKDVGTELHFKGENDIYQSSPNSSSSLQIIEGNESDYNGVGNLEDSSSIQSVLHYLENSVREDIHIIFLRETVQEWNKRYREGTPRFRRCDTFNSFECTPRSRRLINDNSQASTPRSRKMETDGEESLTQKLDALTKCLEAEEDLMLRASSEIKEHSVNNNLVISNCEEVEERDAIEWLLTDDESMFTSVSGKLEKALEQLYASKELLVELEESLEVSDDIEENDIEHEESNDFLRQEDENATQMILSDNVLVMITQFQQAVKEFEQMVHDDLENKCLRLEGLKYHVDTLIQPVTLIKSRKLLYKKAFISRCHNLNLAESEVDLLGDQVETLLSLLEKVYIELNQNATLLSQYFRVFDMLKLISTELNNGAVYTKS